MAINFLDNIQLNQNQLLGARIGLVSSDPTSDQLTGDIIYNSSTNILKYWNGTSWVSLTADTVLPTATSVAIGGVKLFSDTDQSVAASAVSTDAGRTFGVQFNSSDQMVVNVPGVIGSGTINTVSMFTASGRIGDSIYSQNGGATEAKITGGIFVTGAFKDSDGDTGTAGQLLSSTGTLTNWVDAPVGYAKWVLTGDSGTQDIEDGNTVLVAGGTNITTVVAATDKVTINLDDSVTLAGELTVSGSSQSSFAGQVTIPTTPVATTDAASKSYVDSAVAGGLTVKGGFNANTGVIGGSPSPGNLTVGEERVAIAIGDYYVVTTAGNFFANSDTPLTVGDSVLVQTAAIAGESVENNFAIIQSDTDLATLTTVGIGNVNASTGNNNEGLSLSYSNGTGTVGLDIKGSLSAATAVADGDRFAMFQGSTEAQGNFSINSQLMADYFRSKNSFAGTSSSGTSHVFTHNLNTADVIVQVYDASTLETVYANVDRTSVNQVTVTTAATANIRCLVQKIG